MSVLKPHDDKAHDLGDANTKWGTLHSDDVQTNGITVENDVLIKGDLTVQGDNFVATVTKVEATDPIIALAKDNSADTFDIGFYGKSVIDGSPKFHGLVRDATDEKFKVFKDAAAEPGTAVGTHSVATVVADLEVPSGSSLKVPNSAGTLVDYITAVTLGTAAASKVLTVDASKDLTGINNITASGTIQAGNVLISGNAISTSSGSAEFTSVAITGGSIKDTSIGTGGASTAAFTTLTASGATTLNGDVTLGDGTADDIAVTGSLASSIALKADSTYSLGTDLVRMAHVYSDQITASTINAFTAGGAIDFNNENLTNVDIGSGDISGANITVGEGKTLNVAAGTITFFAGQVINADLATIDTADKVSLDALDIDGATEMGEALVDGDLLIVDDGGAGTEKSMLASRIPTYVKSKLSGGTGVTHVDGEFSIGQAVATTSDVTFNTVTASTFTGKVTDISNHDTDNLIEGSNLYFTNERVDNRVNDLITDGQAIGSTYDDTANTLTLAVDTATTTDLGVASFAAADFNVSGGAVAIKTDGISNDQIANPAMSIAGTTVSLGGTLTAANIVAAIEGESIALTAVTNLDGPADSLTIFDTLNSSGTLTVGHSNGIIAIPGDLDLTGDMKDDLNLVATKKYQIDGTNVLTNTTLGSGVVTSSLTSVGALAGGNIADGFGTISTANNISTTKVIDLASDADAADFSADSGIGRLTLGASGDLNLYHHDDSYIVNKEGSLKIDVPTSKDIQFSVNNVKKAHIDADGIDLVTGNSYLINNASVLSATTLGSNVVTSSLTTVGALDSGSITENFTSIDVGSGAISTSGTLSGGILAVDNVQINGSNIGHTTDTALLTVASGTLTVAGRVDLTTLAIGGTDIVADATELNYVDGVTSSIQTQIDTKAPAANPSFSGTITFGDAAISETELEILDGATITTAQLNYLSNASSSIQTQLDNKQGLNTQLTTLADSLAADVAAELVALADGEIEVLDGAIAGSAIANKALVVDGSQNIDSLGTVTATKFDIAGVTGNNKWNATDGLTVDNVTISSSIIRTASGQNLTLNAGSNSIICEAQDSFQVTSGLISAGYRQKQIERFTSSQNLQGYSALAETHIVAMDSSSNTTLDLPNPDELTQGREIVVKNIGAGDVVVQVHDDTNIDGAATKTLTQYQSATFVIIQSSWYTT